MWILLSFSLKELYISSNPGVGKRALVRSQTTQATGFFLHNVHTCLYVLCNRSFKGSGEYEQEGLHTAPRSAAVMLASFLGP